jgi:deazaflavin-dependent oxidoreductase (nitroreductase family)
MSSCKYNACSKIEESRYTSMAKTFQVNFATRMRDSLIMALLRAGVNMGTTSLLTVRGRTSGQPHTVLVRLIEQDGQRWLVAPYGVDQWVRNLRVAGQATLTRGRRSEAISVTDLPAQEAAPILKQYLLNVAAVRPFFDVTKDSPLEAFEQEAPRHPVFRITLIESQQKESGIKAAG